MFADPEDILKKINLKAGMHVADLGSGTGFFALGAAKEIGPRGRVYAVEVQKDLGDKIKIEAERLKLRNIDVITGDAEKLGGTKLSDGAVDTVIASNILFQIEDKNTFAKESSRILKSRGTLLLIDWKDSFRGMGPEAKLIVPEPKARELFLSFGFEFDSKVDAGEHHYGIIFRKK